MTLGYGLGPFPKMQVASIRVVGHIEGSTQVLLFDAADDHDPLLRPVLPAPPDIALTLFLLCSQPPVYHGRDGVRIRKRQNPESNPPPISQVQALLPNALGATLEALVVLSFQAALNAL